MNTVVNYKTEDVSQDFPPESGKQHGKTQRHETTRRLKNAIAWGSYPGQAIAVRRAAQERRSKQTWPVMPASTTSKERFSRSSAEASNATLKSCLSFSGGTVALNFSGGGDATGDNLFKNPLAQAVPKGNPKPS